MIKESNENLTTESIFRVEGDGFRVEINENGQTSPVSEKNRGGTGMTCFNIYELIKRNNSVIVVDSKNDLLV
ncbi:hypothetical protein LIZ91_06445 [Enterococcus avium]|uniref:hypothetical protein n=1 Tax=Enterococcus avium TaxID=33945 RepID=UPI001D08725A|nr:hypothetical protein [Enterococcus avium]MCB6916223.1 hypothetical protein [Enterococcus avium]MCQ4960079.1 hypothetical protein [Enterococcus avium]